jgi:hypothetical protein
MQLSTSSKALKKRQNGDRNLPETVTLSKDLSSRRKMVVAESEPREQVHRLVARAGSRAHTSSRNARLRFPAPFVSLPADQRVSTLNLFLKQGRFAVTAQSVPGSVPEYLKTLTSELQETLRISTAVFGVTKKN